MILNYNLDLFSRIVSMYITCNVCHFSYLHYVVSLHRLFQNFCCGQQHYMFMRTKWAVKS